MNNSISKSPASFKNLGLSAKLGLLEMKNSKWSLPAFIPNSSVCWLNSSVLTVWSQAELIDCKSPKL